MKNQPKPAQWVLMASGAVMLLFSFFDFVEVNILGQSKGFSAWSSDAFFPLSFWPVLFGVIIGVVVALSVFASVSLPDRVLTLDWKQIYFLLAFAAFFILFGLLFVDVGGLFDKSIGFWLMFLASIGLVVGSVMELQDRSSTSGPSRQGPATPF